MGDAKTRLDVLAEEVASCTRCRLHEGRTMSVFHRGDPTAQVMFVGEGPGETEDQKGEPFVGASGKLLDKLIAEAGFARDKVYVCNVVKCRPPGNRKPETDEIIACRSYLVQQIEIVRPRMIVALGATAVRGLFPYAKPGGITSIRGQWKLYGDIPVMPTLHPSYVLREPFRKRDVRTDLAAVMAKLGGFL